MIQASERHIDALLPIETGRVVVLRIDGDFVIFFTIYCSIIGEGCQAVLCPLGGRILKVVEGVF